MKKHIGTVWLAIVLLPIASALTHGQVTTWQSMGGPFGGDITSIVAAANGDIYAGSNFGGLFRSTDDGERWSEPDTSMRNLEIDGLAVAPNGHVFAYGPPSITADASWRPGLYRSTDGGASWLRTNNPSSGFFPTCCAVGPNGNVYVGSFSGLYRSTDGGTTWAQIGSAGAGGNISRVIVARDGTVYYVTLEISDPGRMVRYREGGDTATLALPAPINGLNDIVIRRTGELIVATFDGLYRSRDRGTTWTTLTFGAPILPTHLAVDSTGTVYGTASPFGTYRSDDTGTTWTQALASLPLSGVASLAVGAERSVLLGTNGDGVYRSSNGGDAWAWKSSGIVGTTVQAMVTSTSGRVFAGTFGGGMHRADVTGWKRLNLDRTHVTSLAALPDGSVYAGTYSPGFGASGLFRTTDDGETWLPMDVPGVSAMAIAIDRDGTMYYTNGFVLFRRTTGEATFAEIRNGEGMDALAVDSAGRVFLAVRDTGVLVSTDRGNSWAPGTGIGGDESNVTTIAVGRGELYAVDDSLYRSTDGGATWSARSFPAEQVSRPITIGVDRSGRVVLGTETDGTFITSDHGDSWQPIGFHPPTPTVRSVAQDSTGALLAGADNRGVYRSVTLSGGVVTGRRGAVHTVRCAPNPCATSTSLMFTVDRVSVVQVDVFDARGALARRVGAAEFHAGPHTLAIDLDGLAAGTYTVRTVVNGSATGTPITVLR